MNYRLIIDLQNSPIEVALPADFNINMVLNTNLVGLKQNGSFIFRFTLPITKELQQKFGYPEIPSSLTNRKRSFRAVLLSDSNELFRGFLNLRKTTHKNYEVDMTKTPGNISRNLWESKLSELNFGSDTLDTQNTQTGVFVQSLHAYNGEEVFPEFSPWGNIFLVGEPRRLQKIMELGRPRIKLYVDSVLTATLDFLDITTNFSNYEAWITEVVTPLKDKVDPLLFDLSIVLDQVKRDKSIMSLTSLNNSVSTVKIELWKWSKSGDDYVDNTLIGKVEEYTFTRIQYADVSQALRNVPTEKPYRFIQYVNKEFYDNSLNPSYSGIVNQRIDGVLTLNTFTNPSAYAVSPCFNLRFIFNKLMEILEFTVVNDIWTDDMKRLYLFTNVALDKQLETVSDLFPFNIYGNTINYGYFMPDWTVLEFIQSFCNLFSLSLDFNDITKTVTVKTVKSVMSDNTVNNISSKVAYAPVANMESPKKYQLKFASADQNISVFKNYPTDETVAADTVEYIGIETKLKPAALISDIDTTVTNGLMQLEAKAKSKLFSQQNERPDPALMFVIDNTAKNVSVTFALKWDGAGGLSSTFHAESLLFLTGAVQWETEIFITERELANWSFSLKNYCYGVVFIPEQLSVKLPITGTSTLKLLSV
ncbi:hypothetical protein [Flectobacillus roseus]|uniref:hypothetical protein n=1 Tax=Flectobacillus roseus TaxID=502259 RepID=UPI0024B67216|nr:hypothetical protein [Flectobacillus roseus]MDI9870593.1 hypothetical protein [Flectobacillus roseus]